MRIEKLIIKNYRSIDKNGIELQPSPTLNVLVGENNAGKSTIFAALEMLKECLNFEGGNPPPRRKYKFQEFDWHRGTSADPIEVTASFKLSPAEGNSLANLFMKAADVPLSGQAVVQIREELCRSVEAAVSWVPGKEESEAYYIKCGFLYLRYNQADLRQRHLQSTHTLKWEELLAEHNKSMNKHSQVVTLEQIAARKWQEKGNYILSFECPEGSPALEQQVIDYLCSKLKNFTDIRFRPHLTASPVLESPDGAAMAAVLYNLKNSKNMSVRQKYDDIRREFQRLFPALRFESVEGPDLVFMHSSAPNYQIPVQAVGMGVVETLIFLTNLMGTTDNILLIDTPELHLHPHAQRLLAGIFDTHKKANQVFVITHSANFVEPSDIYSHRCVRMEGGKTRVTALPRDYFKPIELWKIQQILAEPGHREMFFARRVMLVEGPTELGALEVFAEKLGKPLDVHGVSVVCVGGKKDFLPFIKLLKGFDIAYLVVADSDAVMEVADHVKIGRKKVKTSAIMGQLGRLDDLTREETETLEALSAKVHSIQRRDARGKTVNLTYYNDDHNETLRGIASAHCCHVLPGTFEPLVEDAGFSQLIAEAKGEVGDSKVRQGRYLASKIPAGEIPQTLVDYIGKMTQDL